MVREGLRVWNDPRNSQGMTRWITDRLPNQVDADKDGDVQVPYAPDDCNQMFQHWSLVAQGQPWFSLNARPLADVADCETAPPAPPEPPAPPTQPEPTFQELYAQAELEHGINLASMPYKALLRLQGDITVELSAREA